MNTGAGFAFGIDLASQSQGPLGQAGAYQFINQDGKQHYVTNSRAVGQVGSSNGHAQSHAGLGQQGDTQVIGNGLGAVGQTAAQVGTQAFSGGAGDDINDTHQQCDGIGNDLQIQLRSGNDKEQNIQGCDPAFHTAH